MEIWTTLVVSLFSSVVTTPESAQCTHDFMHGSGIPDDIHGRVHGGSR